MKYVITLLVLSIAFLQVKAQQKLPQFQEEVILINGVSVNVTKALISGDIKQVRKSWLSFVKRQLKEKMKEEGGVLLIKQTVINQITDKRGDLMAYMYKDDDRVSLNVAYKLGYDVYLNSALYAIEFEKLTEFMNFFLQNYYQDYLPGQIKNKNKSLHVLKKESSSAQKTIKSLQSKNKKLEKTTKKSQKKISKMERNMASAKDDETKSKITIEHADLLLKLNETNSIIADNKALIETQESILSSLTPKIDALSKEITSLKLTLIEVRSKVKTSK